MFSSPFLRSQLPCASAGLQPPCVFRYHTRTRIMGFFTERTGRHLLLTDACSKAYYRSASGCTRCVSSAKPFTKTYNGYTCVQVRWPVIHETVYTRKSFFRVVLALQSPFSLVRPSSAVIKQHGIYEERVLSSHVCAPDESVRLLLVSVQPTTMSDASTVCSASFIPLIAHPLILAQIVATC